MVVFCFTLQLKYGIMFRNYYVKCKLYVKYLNMERGRTMKVIKRDGSTVDFDRSKIVVAIQKANNAVDESERIAEDRIENIAHYVESRNRMRLLVEDIQDMVEHQLMQEGKFDLAKAYIIYRYTRALVRKENPRYERFLYLIRNSNKYFM